MTEKTQGVSVDVHCCSLCQFLLLNLLRLDIACVAGCVTCRDYCVDLNIPLVKELFLFLAISICVRFKIFNSETVILINQNF